MKRSFRKWLAAGSAAAALTGAAWAQGYGLPLAETGVPMPQGLASATAGLMIGDDMNLLGGRLSYGLTDEIRVFMDLGIADMDGGDSGPALQAGLLYAFPSDTPADLAARVAFYEWQTDDSDAAGCNAMMLGSMQVYYVGFYVYGGLGLNVARRDSGDDESIEFDVAATLGALFAMTKNWSAFAELSHVDQFFLGAGARYQF